MTTRRCVHDVSQPAHGPVTTVTDVQQPVGQPAQQSRRLRSPVDASVAGEHARAAGAGHLAGLMALKATTLDQLPRQAAAPRAPNGHGHRATKRPEDTRDTVSTEDDTYLPLDEDSLAQLREREPHEQLPGLRERVSALAAVLVGVDVVVTGAVLAVSSLPLWLSATLALVLVLTRPALRLYRPRLRLSWLEELPRSAASWAAAGAAGVIVAALAGSLPVADEELVQADAVLRTTAVALVLTELARVLAMAAGRAARRQGVGGSRTLVLGAGQVGQALAQTMVDFPELGLRPVGFLDPQPARLTVDLPLLARSTTDLAGVIERERIGVVVVSFGLTREAQLVDTIIVAHQMRCTVMVVPRLFELHQDGPDVERLRGYPLVRLRPDPTTRVSWWSKRALDVAMAGLALLCVSPVLAAAALAVLIDSGRPVLFHQMRIGLDGVPFRLHKLRSLRPESEQESQTTWNIAQDSRLGSVGRFLRKTSIDELPQLWNILRGQMSFVGPRPERPGYVELFSIEHERYWARHRVPAGLTGLSQISGLRGDTSIAERARFDNYYIANWSLWLDVRIVVLTVREVLRGGGG